MADSNKERYTNFDLLRILAMIGIVVLHILGHGGILDIVNTENTLTTYLIWLVESLAYFSVNVFVLITGYFMCETAYKFDKVLKLIIQTSFWAILCYLAYYAVLGDFELNGFIKSFFASVFGIYWFSTVYIFLYLLSPYLNTLINNINQKFFVSLIIILVIASCTPFLSSVLNINGKSLLWFITLYLIGVYVRKYSMITNKKRLLLVYALCVFTLWIFKVTTLRKLDYIVWNYNSYFSLAGSICIFLTFKEVKIKNKVLVKIIRYVAPNTFGVYLIHDNLYLRSVVWSFVSSVMVFHNTEFIIIKTLVVVFFVFFISIFLDKLREKLFYLLRIEDFCKRISNKNF